METIYLGIGSNLGDRVGNCAKAIDVISRFANLLKVSSMYETEPMGYRDQPDFINCVIKVQTELSPRGLLTHLKTTENELRRMPTHRWGPRVIDLDIIFFGALIMQERGLVIPHPRAHLRRFVIEPLYEIAPEFIHPVSLLSISEILSVLGTADKVRKLGREFTRHPQYSTVY